MSVLLQVQNIKKSFAGQAVLDEVSFCIGERQKIALIGRNGAGKSTLMLIINRITKADEGEVIISEGTRLGIIEQEDDFLEDETVLEYLLRKSDKEAWQCAKTASIFNLKNERLEMKVLELSGGFQMRVKLTAMLLSDPNLLLLDEPTNYLDLSTMLLLENFLISYKGACLIISHDRRFIKNVCKEVVDIERGKAYHFPGRLEAYLAFKREKLEEVQKINKKLGKKKAKLQKFIDRFGAKASKAKQAKSKEKQMKRIEMIAIENSLKIANIKIPEATNRKGFAYRNLGLEIGYKDKSVASDIEVEISRGEHLALLGDNGEGKSTYLKTLAVRLDPIAGKIRLSKNLRIAYYAQHISRELNGQETVERYLERKAGNLFRIEQVMKMAGDFLFSSQDLKKPISVLSGGEKARLCLAGIFLQENDILLLDEPTNHLDFETAESLALALAESNATVIFTSHDRTFTSIVSEGVLEVKKGRIKRLYGDYIEYLERLLDELKIKKTEEKKKEENKKKEERKAIYEKSKKNARQMQRIEKNLEDLKKEKDELIGFFLENPTSIDLEKQNRLKELEQIIIDMESEWMSLAYEY
ncbi:ABC transporter [Candidatus Parcubacteria bacterium]|nr:MAG: ABC transporter [Candidatus Parcubacteria bacterium]